MKYLAVCNPTDDDLYERVKWGGDFVGPGPQATIVVEEAVGRHIKRYCPQVELKETNIVPATKIVAPSVPPPEFTPDGRKLEGNIAPGSVEQWRDVGKVIDPETLARWVREDRQLAKEKGIPFTPEEAKAVFDSPGEEAPSEKKESPKSPKRKKPGRPRLSARERASRAKARAISRVASESPSTEESLSTPEATSGSPATIIMADSETGPLFSPATA